MSVSEQISIIGDLMEKLDFLALEEPGLGTNPNWTPESAEGKRLFAELTSPDHREALRSWYVRLRGTPLNPVASALKKSLERAVGEQLC